MAMTAIGSFLFRFFKVERKAMIRNRCNQISHLTNITTWESDKKPIKHHLHESREISLFPAGDHRAARYR